MSAAEIADRRPRPGWRAELRALLGLGGPLIAAQLATIAINVTDVAMLGWLGPGPLASAALANALFYPFFMAGTGVLMAVAPMAAQALGARRRREVRRTVRQGLWLATALSALAIPALLQSRAILAFFGQDAAVAAGTAAYLDVAAWQLAPAFAFTVARGFLAAHGDARAVMAATLGGFVLHAALNWALIFGNLGAPALGLVGAAISTVLTHAAMALGLWAHLLTRRRFRRYALLARLHHADWPRFVALLRLGAPIGLMLAAETGLFSGMAILMGWLGPDELAAHAVALQIVSAAFMAPLGFSHATTARVGLFVGAGDARAAALSAWTALGATLAFMGSAGALFYVAPGGLVGLFLAPDDAGSAPAFALATSYLAVGALFQLLDGAQVSVAGALRGMGDTVAPMLAAVTGYWLVGLPMAWALAFPLGLRGEGVWLGIAAGLAAASTLLVLRLVAKTRRA